MIYFIAKFIADLFGFDISKVQRYVFFAVIGLALFVVILLGLWLKACVTKPAKIDIKAIDKINHANEVERKAELQKVITENAETVRTVDQRNTIAETNETEKQAAIYAKIAEADRKVQEAHQQGRDVTGPELDCLLTGQGCQ